MADKIRTFKKVKSKRASPQLKVKEISINSSHQEVDEFLKEKYGYGIWHFIYSLYWAATLYKLHNLKKEIALLEARVRKLKAAKARLIENIDQFLKDADIWEGIKRGYPELGIKWTPDNREKFIVSNFQLVRFLKIIDDRIEKINRRIGFLQIYTKFPGKRLRITPRNLIILIWSKVMLKEGNKEKIDFENVAILLNWFSLNKNWADMFKTTKLVSSETPRLTYHKYIKFAKNEKYDLLSTYLYIESFPDISERMIHMFPDPFELVKQEIESRKIMAENEFEKATRKAVF